MTEEKKRMTEEELKKTVKTGDHLGVKFYDIAPLVGNPQVPFFFFFFFFF